MQKIPRLSGPHMGLSLCFVLMCFFSLLTDAQADTAIRFARTPAMSPDGSKVAFSWRGNIWVAPLKGAQRARRLTSHRGYDAYPVWSPDGKWLAFASKRFGNFDVFVMKSDGGLPQQLTHHSDQDLPAYWSNDSRSIAFRSSRDRVHTSRHRLFVVPREGGMPRLAMNLHSAGAALSQDGQYTVFARGSARWYRKRFTMPFHSRLWLYNHKKDTFRQLTGKGYVADAPSWLNAQTIIYRSAKGGKHNLWRYDIKTNKATQLTHYKDKGIRFPAASRGGTGAVFARWDGLFHWDARANKVRKLKLRAFDDRQHNDLTRLITRGKVSGYAVAPGGREVAFVIRGNIFAKGLRDPHPWARKVAPSYWRERHLSWSPDGSKLAFVSDRGGRNAIYLAHAGTQKGLVKPLSRTWHQRVTRLSKANATLTEHHPIWSPNGKTLAFVRGRGALVLHDVKSGKQEVLVSGWSMESFKWSPDSRWIAFIRYDSNSNPDLFLVATKGHRKGRVFNVSRFPDVDEKPVWSANGRVLAYLSRDVYNRMSINYVYLRHTDHEKNTAERKADCRRWAKKWKRVIIKRKKARAKARRYATLRWRANRKAKPTSKPSKPVKKAQKKVKQAKKKRKKLSRVRITRLNRLPFRIRRVPFVPGFQGAINLAVSPTGCQFYFTTRGRGISGLYRINHDGSGLKRLSKGTIRALSTTADGKLFFIKKKSGRAMGGRLMMMGPRSKRPKAVRFRAEVQVSRHISYLQRFQEGWNMLNEWFYDPTFHGAPWAKLRKEYTKLIALVTTDDDFADAIRMLLGELNASHLGVYPPYKGPRNRTGDLGVRFDATHKGKGLKVSYIRREGPLNTRRSQVKVGDTILAVDGAAVTAKTNIYQFLNNKTGRYVVLQVKRRSGKIETVVAQPISGGRARLQRYLRWQEKVRARVKKMSGGLLSYAHIRSMNITSLHRFERALSAHTHGTQALVIDVRNNGGGWTADLLLTMFFPKPHGYTIWRGSKKGYPVTRRPFFTWHKPSILLCNQRSVSNAEIFSHAYKNLKIGTLVGMPTYGGVISTRTLRLVDGTWFRIPLRGWWALPGKKNMENGPAVPNVLVKMSPDDERKDRDPQLLKAVRLLLKQLAGK